MSDLIISDEVHDNGTRRAFFVERGGQRLGEITLEQVSQTVWNIDHTRVDDALRGQGAGRTLLDAAVAWARKGEVKLTASCSYVSAQFAKDASFADVLAKAPSGQ